MPSECECKGEENFSYLQKECTNCTLFLRLSLCARSASRVCTRALRHFWGWNDFICHS